MPPPHKVVLASSNPGKLEELRHLFAPLAIELISQDELQIDAVEETAVSFVENALAKARHAALLAGRPAIADDSGLVVEALQGAPGIYSARFAGARATDADNNRKLLAELAAVTGPHKAFFYCVLVYLRQADDPAPLIAAGRWHGQIVAEAAGTGGFGYDPHFFVPELGKTAAQLSGPEKRQHSHRGIAAKQLLAQYQNMIGKP